MFLESKRRQRLNLKTNYMVGGIVWTGLNVSVTEDPRRRGRPVVLWSGHTNIHLTLETVSLKLKFINYINQLDVAGGEGAV